jgi:NTP pyrophosphatase (non-canonical NTP hydrolase)
VDLVKMEADVLQYCHDMGWYDEDVPFEDAMALLHEEAAEAGSAWRKWGLEDHTGAGADPMPGFTPAFVLKPEGVGSEFADILIRALDDSTRYGLNLAERIPARAGMFGTSDRFLTNINVLHGLIARTSMAWDARPDYFYKPDNSLADVVRFTMQLCGLYGVDLEAEYERKMQYNRTRPYRHGDKRA